MPAAGPRFTVDPARLYEVGQDGTPRTDTGRPPEWLGPRHRRILSWVAVSGALTATAGILAAACLLLGARLWAARFGLAALLVSPLLLAGPALDWLGHRGPRRRRHRRRSPEFPPA